jgi:acetyl-CoA carboxylase carboxyltransferase component
VAQLRDEYRADVDLMLLASELVVDDVVPFERLRDDLVRRFAALRTRPDDLPPPKKHGVYPV